MRALYLHKLNQEKAQKLGKGRKAERAPCLAVERLESIAQFNEPFGQGQTSILTWIRNWLESQQISSFVERGREEGCNHILMPAPRY